MIADFSTGSVVTGVVTRVVAPVVVGRVAAGVVVGRVGMGVVSGWTGFRVEGFNTHLLSEKVSRNHSDSHGTPGGHKRSLRTVQAFRSSQKTARPHAWYGPWQRQGLHRQCPLHLSEVRSFQQTDQISFNFHMATFRNCLYTHAYAFNSFSNTQTIMYRVTMDDNHKFKKTHCFILAINIVTENMKILVQIFPNQSFLSQFGIIFKLSERRTGRQLRSRNLKKEEKIGKKGAPGQESEWALLEVLEHTYSQVTVCSSYPSSPYRPGAHMHLEHTRRCGLHTRQYNCTDPAMEASSEK